jgi:hypothetical protein
MYVAYAHASAYDATATTYRNTQTKTTRRTNNTVATPPHHSKTTQCTTKSKRYSSEVKEKEYSSNIAPVKKFPLAGGGKEGLRWALGHRERHTSSSHCLSGSETISKPTNIVTGKKQRSRKTTK